MLTEVISSCHSAQRTQFKAHEHHCTKIALSVNCKCHISSACVWRKSAFRQQIIITGNMQSCHHCRKCRATKTKWESLIWSDGRGGTKNAGLTWVSVLQSSLHPVKSSYSVFICLTQIGTLVILMQYVATISSRQMDMQKFIADGCREALLEEKRRFCFLADKHCMFSHQISNFHEKVSS